MTRITLTPELAYASGTDAGNASMRKAGRTRWNDEDRDIAAERTIWLMAYCYPVDIAIRMLTDAGLDPATHPETKAHVNAA